jgi:hypothetical protein
MDVSAIITEYGAHYLGAGNQENRNRLFHKMYEAEGTVPLFQEIRINATQWRGARSFMDRVLQTWQKAFTPLDPLSFEPKKIDLFKLKIDLEEEPDVLEQSWLGFMTRLEGFLGAANIDRAQWPIIRYLLEEHVIAKAKENREYNEIFWGQYAAPTPNTPGAAGTTMDGINKLLDDYITAGSIVPVSTGALDSNDKDFVSQVEDFVKQVESNNPIYAGKPMDLCMAQNHFQRYKRGYREKYGLHVDFASDQNVFVQDTNIKVVGLSSMTRNPFAPNAGPSQKLWMTFRENRVRPVNFSENIENYKVGEYKPRVVSIYTDWWEAVDFLMPDAVFVNDADLLS